MGASVVGLVTIIGSFVGSILIGLLGDEFKAWLPWVSERTLRAAVRTLPKDYQGRYDEEWRSHLEEVPGKFGKIICVLSFIWAGWKMARVANREARELLEESKLAKPKPGVQLQFAFGIPVPQSNVALGGSANASCPTCGRRIAFKSGDRGSFISEVVSFAPNAVIVMNCPLHGDFNVQARDFHDSLD
ncbi:MAG: hypothetical protein ABSG16_24860 [Candidatus Acidiferrum sp.]|jgi:hypothetical protein